MTLNATVPSPPVNLTERILAPIDDDLDGRTQRTGCARSGAFDVSRERGLLGRSRFGRCRSPLTLLYLSHRLVGQVCVLRQLAGELWGSP